jgi:competence protein ComEC
MTVDLRLAIPVVVGWVAVGLLIAVPDLLAPTAIVLWALALGCVLTAPRFRRQRAHGITAAIALSCAIAALLVSSAAVLARQRQPAELIDASDSQRQVTATAVTTDTLHPTIDRGPFSARLTSVLIDGKRFAVAVPVIVFGGAPAGTAIVGIGSELSLSGRLSAFPPEDDIAFRFFATGSATITAKPAWFLDWANTLRASFVAAATSLPGDGGALLPGLAIGDTSAVSTTLDTAMKGTSLSHLTAVSGANCAVVVGLIMVAGAALGVPRALRVSAALAVLLGFVVLVTPQPSVLRAAVMAALVLFALARGRPVRGVPVLALAVLILLATDPWLCRSYGFVLSVLATAGLLVLAGPLGRVLARAMPLPVAAMISIPLAAQLACQPVLLMLNPTIPLYGVAANLLAEPAAPLATVLGLIACLLVPLVPAIGQVVIQIAWIPSWWIAAVARFFMGLPGSQLPWAEGAVGVILLTTVTAIALFITLRTGANHRRSRRIAAAALAVILIGYLGSVVGDRIGRELRMPSDWQIAACDVGQGDAVLVRSAGKVALIDTGPNPASLARCLDELGIGRVTLLVLTHYDLDHVGGTAAVLGRVDHALVGPVSDTRDNRLRESLERAGAQVRQVSRGLTGLLGELSWEVLWPPTPGSDTRADNLAPGNDSSITIAFGGVACVTGCLSSLFLGDLGERPQDLMMAANRLGHVDVVKVAHHGSADQSEELYQKIRATIGIIGVGASNHYGHPTDRLLGILAEASTATERTDRQGMVLVSPGDNGALRVWSEHSGGKSG